MKRIYLDYAATTPVAPEVVEAMLPYFNESFGNASSIHGFGLQAKAALDRARNVLAETLHAGPREIIFTSGGTEANNLAILGTALRQDAPGHVITSAVEHPSVMRACRFLESRGWRVTYLPVDRYGRVSPDALRKALQKDTRLISIMYANNEVGTLNPIEELAQIAAEHRIPFHTDAVQAFAKMEIDVRRIPVTLLSLAGHKIYGPKGIGALYVRRGHKLQKMLHGGSQEFDLRPGTENIPAIVGLARAVELYNARREKDWRHVQELAAYFREKLQQAVPEAVFLGHPEQRYPGVLSFAFPGHESISLVMGLDLAGIAVSNGSACSAGKVEPSHVLRAMGLPRSQQNSAVRFSLGRHTTREDLDRAVEALAALMQPNRSANRRRGTAR